MTNQQWTHYTLMRAYGKGILTATQVREFLSLYRGMK
jgi:hypothetical protein